MLRAHPNMSFIMEDSKPVIDSGTGVMDWQWDTGDDERDSRLTEYTAQHNQIQSSPLMEFGSKTSSMNSLRKHTGFKRPLAFGGLNLSHDVTKGRDIEPPYLPRRSAPPSVIEITDSKPQFLSGTNTDPSRPSVRTTPSVLFVQVDSDSEDEKEPFGSVVPNLAPVSQPRKASLILEQDREATLAASAARREGARKRKAEGGLNNSSAPSKKSKHRFASGTTVKDRGELSRPRPTETLGTRLQTLPSKNDGQSSQALKQDVIVIDSDSESAPRPRPPKNRNPTKSFARNQTADKQSQILAPSIGQSNHESLTERMQKFKRERTSVPPFTPQAAIRPRIEIPDVAASIEKSENRRKRLDAEDAKNFTEKFASERERGKEGTKAIAEHQRRQHAADAASERRRDEETRVKLEQQAKARQAAVEIERQKEPERQRKEKADKEQNKTIALQLQQLQQQREETRKKKSEADAARQGKRAEEEKQRQAERLRSKEEKQAELAKRPSVLDEQARKERDERIRRKKERSAQNKQAEQDENADDELVVEEAPKLKPQSLSAILRESRPTAGSEDDGTVAYPSTPGSASGPVALNSVAGVRAIHIASKAAPLPGASSARTGHDRALGEILDEDAKLLHWKDTGDQWPAIAEKYEKLTGNKRAVETLHKRYKQVSTALNEAGVGSMLKVRMFKGEEDIRRQVNAMVHGQWPLPAKDLSGKDAASKESKTNLTTREIPQDSLPAPGEILPIDALLVRWRQDRMIWSNVMRNYETIAGTRKGEDALRTRWREVTEALEDANVFVDEIEALAHDAPGARAKVNSKVWKVWPPVLKPPQAPRTEALGARSRGSLLKVPPHELGLGPQRLEPIARPAVRAQPLPQVLEDSDTEDASPQRVGRTAGKTITNEVFSRWLQAQQDSPPETDCSASTSGSADDSGSDIGDADDNFYYIWRVYRRECNAEDEEEGFDIREKEWRECGEAYEDLDEANRAAEAETKLIIPGGVDFRDVEVSTKKTISQNCHIFTLSSAEVGILQVMVDRCERLPDDRIPPESKKGWIAANIYFVKTCTTTTSRTVDEVLNETTIERDIREDVVSGTFTSHVDQANSRAARIFAEKVLKKTVDLKFNKIEKMRKVDDLLESMEWDERLEGRKFYGKHEFSEKGTVFEVWTAVERLAGPRNHFQFSKARKEDEQ